MALRIGMDVGRFPEKGGGGLQVYARNLTRAIARSGEEIEIFLYGDAREAIAAASPGTLRQGRGNDSFLSRVPLLHRQILLPRSAAADGVQLVHFLFNGGSVACAVPRVVTVHDLICVLAPRLGASHLSQPYFHLRRGYHRLVIPASIRRASLVLASSETTRSDIVRLVQVPADRIRVVPLAADPAFETPPTPAEVASWRDRAGLTAPYVMGFASLDPRKNASRLIGAFARLDPHLRDSHLLAILCPHPYPEAALRSVAAARGLLDRVRFLRFLEQPDLRCLYRGAVCLAFPSLYEGFGLPVLEAFWSGTPVLASRAGSLPEVAGDAAEYADAESEDSIAEGMSALLTDSPRRGKLAAKGRARARLFRWEETARLTIRAYEEVIRPGGGWNLRDP